MKKRFFFIPHPSAFSLSFMPRTTRRRSTNRIAPRPTRRGRTFATQGAILLPRAAAQQIWRARRPKLVAAVLLAACAAALIAFFNLDLFYVYDLDVAGLKYLGKDEIARASGVVGYNIFFIDATAVQKAVKRLPEVEAVRVTAGVPNHLAILVQERQPQVIWLRGSESYWVDSSGTAVPSRGNIAALPNIRDLDQAPVKSGGTVNPSALAALRALLAVWPNAPRTFEWSAARGLAFTDERGWKTYLGDAGQMAGKLAVWRALVAQLVAQRTPVKFIDLGKGDPYYQ